MKKRLKMITVGLTMALGVSTFVGCTENSGNIDPKDPVKPTDNPKPQSVTMKLETYMTGTDPWTPALKDTIKKYMDQNPGVTINDESVPAPGNVFKTKINTDFAAGNEPDVALAFLGSDSKPLVDSGKLLPWDDELKNDTQWAEKIDPKALEAARYTDGKVYGIPYIGIYEGMYFNKELFEKNGVKIPKTYDELLTAVEAFKAKGITPIAISFAEEPHYAIETFVLSLGGKAGHSTPWDASWAPALNYVKELYEKGAFSKDALTIKSSAAQQLFKDQKAAMFISGSWSAASFKDMGDKIEIMPLPMLPNGKADPSDIITSFGSGWMVSKDKNDANGGAALKLAKWITTPEQLTRFIEIGGVPALKGAEPTSMTALQKQGLAMMAASKNPSAPIDSRISQESFQKIWKELSYVVSGRKTADKLLEEAKQLDDKK
ncbi:MAG: extracellular solute-binding protein [Clostridia bacterium]|nr:extracellular solute-binding protein [Clostridia bacterium]